MPTGGEPGNGGSGGSSGTSVRDAGILTIKLDATPASWGSADAPQTPDAPPTTDDNCGMITSRTTRNPVDVLLVLDRSGSMDYSLTENCYCANANAKYGSLCTDTTNCTTRWNAVKPAVHQTLSSSSYVNWGLKFFPSDGAGQNCTLTSTIEVPITSTSASTVESAVESATFDYSTPTAAAISAAVAYLKTLDDGNQKIILLATDGEPNCGGTRPNVATDDLTGATSAAADALTAGFQVYVIGIGPNLSNLTQLAKVGGTTDFYPVDSPQGLVDALSSISKLVGSCSFKSDQAPPDPSNIAVYVNGQIVTQDATNGWTFGADAQEIVLTGDACSQISKGNQVDVQILFGCQGQPSFPPSLY
jgi:Mg-chelatase subunit ChlD